MQQQNLDPEDRNTLVMATLITLATGLATLAVDYIRSLVLPEKDETTDDTQG